MQDSCRNIYRNARQTAGLTQERWAEQLGISVEAVRQYEAGIIMPGDEIVLAMAEISGQLILPYWHLTRKSRIAGRILPELEEQQALAEAVLGLLIQIDEFRDKGLRSLMQIAADGKVDETERAAYRGALDQLQQLVKQAFACGYAKE